MKKTAVYVSGRFQPPTPGHRLLFKRARQVADTMDADLYIFPTSKENPNLIRDPLSQKEKIDFIKSQYQDQLPGEVTIGHKKVTNPFNAYDFLKTLGYEEIIIISGDDRATGDTSDNIVARLKKLGKDDNIKVNSIVLKRKSGADITNSQNVSGTLIRGLALLDKDAFLDLYDNTTAARKLHKILVKRLNKADEDDRRSLISKVKRKLSIVENNIFEAIENRLGSDDFNISIIESENMYTTFITEGKFVGKILEFSKFTIDEKNSINYSNRKGFKRSDGKTPSEANNQHRSHKSALVAWWVRHNKGKTSQDFFRIFKGMDLDHAILGGVGKSIGNGIKPKEFIETAIKKLGGGMIGFRKLLKPQSENRARKFDKPGSPGNKIKASIREEVLLEKAKDKGLSLIIMSEKLSAPDKNPIKGFEDWGYSAARIAQEGEKSGHQVYLVDSPKAWISGTDEDGFRIHNLEDKIGHPLVKGKAIVITRSGAVKSKNGRNLMIRLEQMLDFVVNPIECIDIAGDKFTTFLKLSEAGVSTPLSVMVPGKINPEKENMEEILKDLHSKVGGKFPVVLKTASGSQGTGVTIVESWKGLVSVIQTLQAASKEIELMLQEYHEINGDLRIHVWGKEIKFVMKRKKIKKDFRSNFSLGGDVIKIEIDALSDSQKELILNAHKACKGIWTGVDLMVDKNTKESLIIEVNSSAGIEGIEGLFPSFAKDFINWITDERQLDKYITEEIEYLKEETVKGANVHLDHVEDLVIDKGETGKKDIINRLDQMTKLIGGKGESTHRVSVKWDGAPAVFCGFAPEDYIDPITDEDRTGQFFIATKSFFNKNPKVNFNKKQIKSNHPAGPGPKLLLIFDQLKRIFERAIPENQRKNGPFWQGDFMFTNDDLKQGNLSNDDSKQKMVWFQPNTLVYAAPAKSKLANRWKKSNLGVIFHTFYPGLGNDEEFNNQSAYTPKFNENMAGILKASKKSPVWIDDATHPMKFKRDVKFENELLNINKMINRLKRLKIDDIFTSNNEITTYKVIKGIDIINAFKVFHNSKIRQFDPENDKSVITSPRKYANEFIKSANNILTARATKKIKKRTADGINSVRKFLNNPETKNSIEKIAAFMKLARMIKDRLVVILNDGVTQTGDLRIFVKDSDTFTKTNPEGFVGIDDFGGATKFNNRTEFNRLNFLMFKN